LCNAAREPAVERIFALDQGFLPGSPTDEKEDNCFVGLFQSGGPSIGPVLMFVFEKV